jgi:hypothetical protein
LWILKQKLVNAVNFPGKRQPTVGLDIYIAKLDIRYEERIAQYTVALRVVMKKDGLDFFCRVLYFLQVW